MTTVAELLDDLAGGRVSIEDVESDFRSRRWTTTGMSAWDALGDADAPPPDPDSFDAVATDPRLDLETKQRLARAARRER